MEKIVMIAKLKAKQKCAAALEKELKALAEESHKESGCLLYALHKDTKDPGGYTLIERWASKKDLDLHYASHHFQKHVKMIKELVASDIEFAHLESLSDGKSKKGSLG